MRAKVSEPRQLTQATFADSMARRGLRHTSLPPSSRLSQKAQPPQPLPSRCVQPTMRLLPTAEPLTVHTRVNTSQHLDGMANRGETGGDQVRLRRGRGGLEFVSTRDPCAPGPPPGLPWVSMCTPHRYTRTDVKGL